VEGQTTTVPHNCFAHLVCCVRRSWCWAPDADVRSQGSSVVILPLCTLVLCSAAYGGRRQRHAFEKCDVSRTWPMIVSCGFLHVFRTLGFCEKVNPYHTTREAARNTRVPARNHGQPTEVFVSVKDAAPFSKTLADLVWLDAEVRDVISSLLQDEVRHTHASGGYRRHKRFYHGFFLGSLRISSGAAGRERILVRKGETWCTIGRQPDDLNCQASLGHA